MVIRYAKIMFCFFISMFCFLVFLGNVTDYDANYQFVQHVMRMDTIFPDNPLQYRSIDNRFLHQIVYLLIILAEGVTSFLFFFAGVKLWKVRNAPSKVFQAQKATVFLAAMLAFSLWFFGFMAIGGEWFLMWQSKIWNGQQAAFRIYITILVVLVLIMQPEEEL